ncbi:Transcription initiation factor IIE subunit beta [Ceratocystis fimbriata CBS 114723]|uniref:Transcription initiation factor IIE subunit beta n=2 Tax=Ceratocystis TaxID=5157 RepID=A0A0F8CVP0_CERFI|nr:Transcription initiation factor IIE subunit beta [Ceratocystis platani]PHH51550.1 Transcription initiation factor IIE subunit beta [Ceratocystis fimbriata CBS 114723]
MPATYTPRQSKSGLGASAIEAASKMSKSSSLKNLSAASNTSTRAVSPAPSAAGSRSDLTSTPTKRKRDAPGTVYSQPDITGFGNDLMTQMTFAVEFLKGKDNRMPVQDILAYLSLTRFSEDHQKELVETMRRHPRIEFFPDPNLTEQTWKSGTYAHRPLIPGVRDKISLLQYLQKRTDAQGVQVRELKDGWPDCEPALTELEKERKILVCRTKKDNVPRQVFLDDASLFHHIDPDFQKMWLTTIIPKVDELPRKLMAVGQRPTSDDPSAIKTVAPKGKAQKKRAVRKVGKATNEHMEALLRENGHFLPGMATTTPATGTTGSNGHGHGHGHGYRR